MLENSRKILKATSRKIHWNIFYKTCHLSNFPESLILVTSSHWWNYKARQPSTRLSLTQNNDKATAQKENKQMFTYFYSSQIIFSSGEIRDHCGWINGRCKAMRSDVIAEFPIQPGFGNLTFSYHREPSLLFLQSYIFSIIAFFS